MQITYKNLIVNKIIREPYESVPRAHLKNEDVEMYFDYYEGVFLVNLSDKLTVTILSGNLPSDIKAAYIMHGIIYEVGNNFISLSFGGLICKIVGIQNNNSLENIDEYQDKSEVYFIINKE